ncbi:THBS2S [Mytilus coruscus]|uniref:THBS2S n=1 Tax=Mytilus coruscus TaxID=42192 RepID=A0A6J8B2T5_MYTCO|nr:THBS2S [Mytilus coruscus]
MDSMRNDAENGMWSDDGSPYLPSNSGSSCSGCTCRYNQGSIELGTCTNSISVTGRTISNVTAVAFPVTATSINFFGCSFTNISEDTFSNITGLTILTIRQSGLTFMPDVSKSQITTLNLIGNAITLDSKYKGTLPDTIEYLYYRISVSFTREHYQILQNISKFYKGTLPDTIEYLALTSNQIYWLPPGFINGSNLRLVSLGENAFVNFPATSLGELPNIMYFGIESNQLTKISSNHLLPLNTSTFVHLNLSNNAIQYVQRGAFSQLQNLKILDLHGNSISQILKGVFENLKELIHLDLHHNKLEKLTSESFIDLEKLIEFRLHSQSPVMTTIMFDSMINIGTALKYLFISQNGLTHLPHQIFMEANFTELIELYADNNLIKNVTELVESAYGVKLRPTYLQKKQQFLAFSTTPNIVKLYLQNNLIEMINNTDFCELQLLQLLNLRSNQLNETHIQEEGFKCLSVMNYLDLGNNHNMQFVPVALTTHERLPSIQTLYLENNMISVLPTETFTNVSTLITLYLHDNRIVAVEDGAFPCQVNTIYMQNNHFRFIHEHPFSYLSELRTLYLSNNAIDYIPDDAFINATSLAYLQLSSNKITQIKKIHFENCPLTSALDLSNNEIGWIEDGSLNHVTSSGSFDFSYNRLYKLPMNGTFHDLSLSSSNGLNLQNNRISAILPDTFKSFTCNGLVIESNAFNTVSAGVSYGRFSFNGNLLGEIQSYAFNGTTCNDFYMQNLNLGIIPSYAFTDFTCRRVYLQSSSITDIKKHAFNNFRANDYFYLHSNQLTTISSSIFGGTSYVEYLQMYSNGITSITSDGFRNVDVDYIYLQNNGLTVYPIALNDITPIQIDFHDNQIQYIEEGSFNGLLSLQTLNLGENVIPYFPSVILPAIRTLNLADNRIEALGGLNLGGSLTSVNLDSNFLGCECSTVESLYNVKDDLSASTMCYSPTALQGVLFATSQSSSSNHFTKKDVALFQCSGENIIGSAVSSTNITITWDRPSYLYSLVNSSNAETVTAETVTNNIKTWEYLVTCTSNTAATLTKIQTVELDFSKCIIVTPCNTTTDNTTVTSSNSTAANTTVTDCNTVDSNCTKSTDHTTSVSFSDVDGLLPQTLYECVIQLTVDNYTSAKSVPTFIFTPAVITGKFLTQLL